MKIILAALLCLSLLAGNAAGQDGRQGKYRILLRDTRTYSGAGNSRFGWGAVGLPLLRLSYIDYPDGIGETFRQWPNPRQVSNLVIDQQGLSLPSAAGLSDAVWAWGQFVDHDLDLTDSDAANGTADIPVLDPWDLLYPTIFVNRSNHIVVEGIRQQINEISSFLDGSQVYGSDEDRARALRTLEGGRLKTSAGNLLPFNVDGLPNLGQGPGFFVAGDIRSNENVVLTSLHTLFVREHNRLANRIRALAPDESDERIFQLARKIVGAEIQLITYHEFLPALLGPFAPSPVARYQPRVDPTVATEFSSAAFRVGHTLLSPMLQLGDTGQQLALRDAFSDPDFLANDPDNVGRLLLGLCRQPCQEIDARVIDDVRNFLLLPAPFPLGLDLAAINMQRGREHGIPPYNEVRMAFGLPPVKSFAEISSDVSVQQQLQNAYGTVEAVDAWVGGIAEDHLPGAQVGPLVMRVLFNQFRRTRDGDRFFFSRDPDLKQLLVRRVIDLDSITLGKLIRLNCQVNAPDNMFTVHP
jgi:hypothetical protein